MGPVNPAHRVPRLPPGTQVVLRQASADTTGTGVQRGATGRVTGDLADGRYTVVLTDGRAVPVAREHVALRRAYQHEVALAGTSAQRGGNRDGDPDGRRAGDPGPAWLVREHTVYAAVVGSRAFGLAREGSDTDTRGVYLAPAPAFWGLVPPPLHVEGPDPEWFSWELARFCELALKANPNLFEVLWSPLVVRLTPVGEELLAIREAFLSQLAYQTYNGYVLSQFTKIEADLRRDGYPRWKHVMHLLRLLLSARDLLVHGRPLVDVGPHRDRLLAVRAGAESWEDVERWRLELHATLDEAVRSTPLPAVPDVRTVDEWLRDVRRRSAAAALGAGA